jgi:hypothetical protein
MERYVPTRKKLLLLEGIKSLLHTFSSILQLFYFIFMVTKNDKELTKKNTKRKEN